MQKIFPSGGKARSRNWIYGARVGAWFTHLRSEIISAVCFDTSVVNPKHFVLEGPTNSGRTRNFEKTTNCTFEPSAPAEEGVAGGLQQSVHGFPRGAAINVELHGS